MTNKIETPVALYKEIKSEINTVKKLTPFTAQVYANLICMIPAVIIDSFLMGAACIIFMAVMMQLNLAQAGLIRLFTATKVSEQLVSTVISAYTVYTVTAIIGAFLYVWVMADLLNVSMWMGLLYSTLFAVVVSIAVTAVLSFIRKESFMENITFASVYK